MTDSPSSGIPPSAPLARWLSAFSICLLAVFLAGVLTAALPTRLMDPQWQLALVAAIVSNASLAVVGALLLALAVWVHPAGERLRARLRLFRRWALVASLGFLLLIPLQGAASWRLYSTVTAQQQQQSSQAGRKLADLRAAIASADTHQELQAAVKKLFGASAGLSPAEVRTPMAELRPQLLAKADQAAQQIVRQNESRPAIRPEAVVKDTLRSALASLAYAAGFAVFSGVLPRGQDPIGSRGTVVDEDYFETLAN